MNKELKKKLETLDIAIKSLKLDIGNIIAEIEEIEVSLGDLIEEFC